MHMLINRYVTKINIFDPCYLCRCYMPYGLLIKLRVPLRKKADYTNGRVLVIKISTIVQ